VPYLQLVMSSRPLRWLVRTARSSAIHGTARARCALASMAAAVAAQEGANKLVSLERSSTRFDLDRAWDR
jgi:hypothetical protein